MNSGDILRYVMIIVGVYLLWVAILSLAKRKMTEPFSVLFDDLGRDSSAADRT